VEPAGIGHRSACGEGRGPRHARISIAWRGCRGRAAAESARQSGRLGCVLPGTGATRTRTRSRPSTPRPNAALPWARWHWLSTFLPPLALVAPGQPCVPRWHGRRSRRGSSGPTERGLQHSLAARRQATPSLLSPPLLPSLAGQARADLHGGRAQPSIVECPRRLRRHPPGAPDYSRAVSPLSTEFSRIRPAGHLVPVGVPPSALHPLPPPPHRSSPFAAMCARGTLHVGAVDGKLLRRNRAFSTPCRGRTEEGRFGPTWHVASPSEDPRRHA